MFRPRRVRRGFRRCMHAPGRRGYVAVRARTPRDTYVSSFITHLHMPAHTAHSRLTCHVTHCRRRQRAHSTRHKSTHSHTILVHRDAKARQLERTPPKLGANTRTQHAHAHDTPSRAAPSTHHGRGDTWHGTGATTQNSLARNTRDTHAGRWRHITSNNAARAGPWGDCIAPMYGRPADHAIITRGYRSHARLYE